MQVEELLSLTDWVKAQIKEAEIPESYQALQTKLQQNAQANQPQQPFEAEKDALFDRLRSVPLNELTNEQLRFLDCIGIGGYVGPEGVRGVEDILIRNPLDLATVASRLTDQLQSIAEGIGRSERLAQDLEDCVVISEALGDDILIRVKFAGDASIADVVDLKKWSEVWHGIVRGITMAHGQSPSDVRVIGAGQGSLIFDLAAPEAFALTVTGIVYAALRVAEKVVQIQKQAEEVKGLKLTNKKIAKDLDSEASKVEEKGVEEVTAEFTAKLKLNPTQSGDVVTALGRSVTDLVRFLRQGGEVDCVLPDQLEDEEEVTDESRQQLMHTLHQIRELERRLRELGPGAEETPWEEG